MSHVSCTDMTVDMYAYQQKDKHKFGLNDHERFTMKTVLPSPGPPSTTTIPPLDWDSSTISTAPTSSLALPKNCLCSAPWCTSCSVALDAASALLSFCHTVNITYCIDQELTYETYGPIQKGVDVLYELKLLNSFWITLKVRLFFYLTLNTGVQQA